VPSGADNEDYSCAIMDAPAPPVQHPGESLPHEDQFLDLAPIPTRKPFGNPVCAVDIFDCTDNDRASYKVPAPDRCGDRPWHGADKVFHVNVELKAYEPSHEYKSTINR